MPLSFASIFQIIAEIAILVLMYIIFSRRSKCVESNIERANNRIIELENRIIYLETGRRRKIPLVKSMLKDDDSKSVYTGFSSADEEEDDVLSIYAEEPIVDEPITLTEMVEPIEGGVEVELSDPTPIINELHNVDEKQSE